MKQGLGAGGGRRRRRRAAGARRGEGGRRRALRRQLRRSDRVGRRRSCTLLAVVDAGEPGAGAPRVDRRSVERAASASNQRPRALLRIRTLTPPSRGSARAPAMFVVATDRHDVSLRTHPLARRAPSANDRAALDRGPGRSRGRQQSCRGTRARRRRDAGNASDGRVRCRPPRASSRRGGSPLRRIVYEMGSRIQPPPAATQVSTPSSTPTPTSDAMVSVKYG